MVMRISGTYIGGSYTIDTRTLSCKDIYSVDRIYVRVCHTHALSVYSDHLFSGSSDQTINVLGVRTFELQASIKAHEDPVCTLACNDSLLFSGSLRSIKVRLRCMGPPVL